LIRNSREGAQSVPAVHIERLIEVVVGYCAVRKRAVIRCVLGKALISKLHLMGGPGMAHDVRRTRRGGYPGGVYESGRRREREFGSDAGIGTYREP
jgi:hypothetical protein